MPFVNTDINEVINRKRSNDPAFQKAWDDSREEYRLIGEMVSLRKEKKMTQGELAELTGSKQQVISRIEKRENSPSLKTVCNILNALGYELKIVKRSEGRYL
ncbi:Antitoxin HigA [uncultured Roseburia sp.]|uniref:Helix-turn-helix domain-containing protein n=1 Tax=Brotonthovivens ammoniilytica TaxID=2981725 RepID=A0ABT2TFX0_9FIRM|nr:helix-turn-helix transcriptional regulator [Brotonthovivens ammoniilytica]MCU6761083.1 helix-turn-helix domain-containing protein [Brotonthovivens ammoniilytica]SCI18313.1 Antitoxin HigA [uncultured Roseburia sp.]